MLETIIQIKIAFLGLISRLNIAKTESVKLRIDSRNIQIIGILLEKNGRKNYLNQ